MPERTELDAVFAEAVRMLTGLVSGEVSPEAAADWAMPMVADDDADYYLHDKLWRALDQLAGADLAGGTRRYLHGVEDYQAWLDEALA